MTQDKDCPERLTLSPEEQKALAEAYRLLDRIHRRHADKMDAKQSKEDDGTERS